MPVRGRGRGATNTSNRLSPRTQLDVGTSNQNRRTAPAVSNTPRATKSISAQHLPPQYEFTPTNSQPTNICQRSPVPFFQPLTNHGVQNFPPPITLFPNARSHSGASDSPQPRASASPHSSSVHPRPSFAFQPRVSASNPRHSPPTSSQAQNEDEYEEDEDDEAYEEENPEDGDEAQNQFTEAPVEPTLPPDVLDALHELLTQPGREDYTTLLSPHLEPGTTWFGQRKSGLTGKITKIFTNKFNEPYYSWSCVPIPKREKYFLEFAKFEKWFKQNWRNGTYHLDSLIHW